MHSPDGHSVTATGAFTYVDHVGGDINGDGSLNASDVFYLARYLFAGGTAPVGSADTNADGRTDVADLFYLINYLYAGGPAPK